MAQTSVTAHVTNGSTIVTVDGVNLAGTVKANAIFMVTASYVPYFAASDATYSSVDNRSTVTLTGAYADVTGNVSATFSTDFTVPDRIPTISPGDVGTATLFTQAMYRVQALISALAGTDVGSVADALTDIETYTGQAQTAATQAAQSATSASTAATAAASAASAAQTAAASTQDAQAQADAAAAAATLAEKWASNPVNTVVANGEYSAYHWAQQARASLTGQLTFRGLYDASSATYPADPTEGDYYIVNGVGTIDSVAFSLGDALIYGSGAWRRQGPNGNVLEQLLHISNDGLRLGIGAPDSANSMVFLKRAISAGSADILLELQNPDDTGYTQTVWRKSNGDRGVHIGWGNGNAGFTVLKNAGFIYTPHADPIIVVPNNATSTWFNPDGNVSVGKAAPHDYGVTRRVLSVVGKDNAVGGVVSAETFDASTIAIMYSDTNLAVMGGFTENSQLNLIAAGVAQVIVRPTGWTQFTKGMYSTIERPNGTTGMQTIDWNLAQWQYVQPQSNLFLLFTPPTADGTYLLHLRLQQDGIGNRAITWPAQINWAGNVAPVIGTSPNSCTLLTFFCSVQSGAATYFGSAVRF